MAQTVYASFPDAALAEKAAGALLDYGVRQEDISLVASGERGQAQVTQGAAYAANTAPAAGTAHTLGNTGDRAVDDTKSVGHRVAQAGDRAAGYVTGAVGADNTSSHFHAAADQHAMGAEARANMAGNQDTTLGNQERVVYTTGGGNYGTVGTTDRSDLDEMDADDRTVNASSQPVDSDTASHLENAAKHGITTTTGADAGSGAAKGAGIGLVLGAIAAFAVPGVGWALGGGALAAALGATALATGAGAIAGGVAGYLKDQGVPSHMAEQYHGAVQQGGALLSLHLPSGKVDQALAEQVLAKYGGSNVNTY